MDTPYNRRVPLPSKYRRSQKKRSPSALPDLLCHTTGWLLYLALATTVLFAGYWYKSDTSEDQRVIGHRPHCSIAGDVVEATTIIHGLQEELCETDVDTTMSSLTATTDQSVDALSAAASFLACHDQLAIEFVRGNSPDTTCDPLFERVLDCQYQFTKYHELHKRVVTGCEVDIVRELEGQIGRIAEWDRQRATETARGWASPFALWENTRDTVLFRRVYRGVQDEHNRQQNGRAIELGKVLGRFSAKIRQAGLADQIAESQRRNIQQIYGRVLQPFVVAGCGESGSSCLCGNIDLEAAKGQYRDAVLEVKQFLSRDSNTCA